MMKKNSGFTLVEMAVVLIVIGLIAASVISGRAIIHASESRAVMAEIRKHMQSFSQFVERYHAYPGDFRGANTAFNIATSFNGDGNNKIEWGANDEGTKGWYHLQLAGYTDGIYTGTGPNAVIRTNIPGSNVGGGGSGYYLDYNTAMQNHLGLGSPNTVGGINNKPALSPERAEAIDRKLDDGRPSSGFVQSVGTGTTCVTGTGLYNTGAAEAISCVLLVRLN